MPLEDAMKYRAEITEMSIFFDYLETCYGFSRKDIKFHYYAPIDKRIGWSNIFLVMIKGFPYGFVTFDEVKDGTMYNSKGEEIQ